MSIQLFNGDCLEVMKDLSANSIDCFICDLPYGCLTGGGDKEKKRRRFINGKDTGTEIKQVEGVIAGCSWDIKIDLEKFWEQVERLMKNDHTPILMFCNTRFGYELIKSKEDWFRYDLVWNKERGVSFLSANKMPMKSHEMIYVFSKKGAYYNRIDIDDTTKKRMSCVFSIINMKKGGILKDKHPTEKPVALYKWLIERYCPPGGKLLDPTAGSCNSCFAGYELERDCIGIEMDKTFFDTAKKKMENQLLDC